MKKTTFFAVVLPGMWLLLSCGNNNMRSNARQATPADSAEAINNAEKTVDSLSASFAVNAADDGMMEVALGKLAMEKAIDPRVKAFAAMSVNDRTRGNERLKLIAEKWKIALPSTLATASQKHLERLSKKSGKRFEKEYIGEMVDSHDQDLKDFNYAANNLGNVSLREWARKALPVLMVHLDSARAIKNAQ
ncbi:DUF4142 domain-containing protein [Chitinophaga oryzae]|uniref:DUF4142 domain-containing protein n=1 Tax=Chitinophaga oryzae TaxID=2725414 RepID=A0AAE7D6J1_9BACT|nr:DUF4142 domain-containing protein [Chitinophaga oryzae]QJB31200.1 DUF4142 domain-containing protein [Chitinophaga oryzae]QJB37688.1 DUF4142 domain-containing protein [Chitinophaga oryzae]